MKPRLLHASILLLFLPFLLVACNTEDDVMEIFTGRTWKLVRITDESSQNQFDFWNGDEAAQQNSLEGLAFMLRKMEQISGVEERNE